MRLVRLMIVLGLVATAASCKKGGHGGYMKTRRWVNDQRIESSVTLFAIAFRNALAA